MAANEDSQICHVGSTTKSPERSISTRAARVIRNITHAMSALRHERKQDFLREKTDTLA